MRIISDFHDYYDVVQASGQDQSLIYNRKEKTVELTNYPFPFFRFSAYYWPDPFTLQVQQHIVGFCGKVYPVLALALGDTGH